MAQTDKPSRKHKRRSPEEKLAEIEAEMTRIRAREDRKLITAAEKAGYFGIRLSTDQLSEMFRNTIETLKPKRSSLAALEQRKARVAGNKRKDDGRRKALLGSFLVAQCRHKPEFHAAIATDIRAFLKDHPTEAVATRNLALLEGFLADPARSGTGAVQADQEKSASQAGHRDRAHRLILLGAWVLDRHNTRADLSLLINEELEGFLDQGAHPDHHKQMLSDLLP